MKLADLPVEILSALTVQLHGFDVASLWFSGSSLLRYKLANGGIPKLQWYVASTREPFKWPSLFSSLAHLPCFQLHSAYNSRTVLVTSSQLQTLPKTLKEISLLFFGAIHVLNDLLSQNPDCFPVLRKLVITIRNHDTPLAPNQTVHWPQSLHLIKLYTGTEREFLLDLSTLPPNLTKLVGKFREISAPTTTTQFPKSLTNLDLTLSRFFDVVPLLPPGLESLSLSMDYRFFEDEESENRKQFEAWKRQGIKNLPPGLTYIILPIDDYPPHILRQLPPTITKIAYHKSNVLTTAEEFALLPPSLTDCTYLLPRLMNKEIIQRIPKNIYSFESSVTLDAIPYLNPKTSQLTLAYERKDPSTFAVDCVFPRELKSITLPNPNRIPLSALPSSLTHISILEGVMTTSQIQSLPKWLTILRMGDSDASETIEDWKSLPENLLELTFVSRACLPAESSLDLPRRMDTLVINDCQSIYQDWFEGLPQTLEILTIFLDYFAEPFTGTIAWPKSLLYLELNVRNQELDTQTMSNILNSLPKTMIAINIYWSPLHPQFNISKEDKASLSKRLEDLHLP